MQAWATVKVKDETSEHFGRAGTVETGTATTSEVRLDESETHEAGVVEFQDEQLQFLAQG